MNLRQRYLVARAETGEFDSFKEIDTRSFGWEIDAEIRTGRGYSVDSHLVS